MTNPMVHLQEATVKAQCKQLRMPVIAAQFRSVAEQAVREKKSHIGYLEALMAAELEERERNTIARRITEAHLPRVKTLEELHAVTECVRGQDAGARRGRVSRTRRTHPVHRGMRDGENPSSDRAVCGGLPAEETSAVRHGGGPG